jgi:5-methylcytosine-specific restriction endonuclease McrA
MANYFATKKLTQFKQLNKFTEPTLNNWEELELNLIAIRCRPNTFTRYLNDSDVIQIYENDIQKIKDMVYLPEIIKFLKDKNNNGQYSHQPYINERISKYEKELEDYENEKRKLIEQELIKQERMKQELIEQEKQSTKKTKKPPKKKIPAALKRLVWNKYIGEMIGSATCLCCNCTSINQLSFHCGHIISESNGGEMILSNLKPICQNCNSSMGTKNMDDFMLLFK